MISAAQPQPHTTSPSSTEVDALIPAKLGTEYNSGPLSRLRGWYPAISAVCLWLSMNSMMQLLNSFILRANGLAFEYPLFLTLLGRSACCVLSTVAVWSGIGNAKYEDVSRGQLGQMLGLGFLSVTSTAMKNTALLTTGLSVSVTVAAISPVITMTIVTLTQRRRHTLQEWISVTVLVVGCAAAVHKNQEAPLTGLSLTFLAVVMQCAWVVISAQLLQDSKVGKLQLMMITSLPDCIGLVVSSWLFEGVLPYQWCRDHALQVLVCLVPSALMATAYTFVQYMVIQRTSPVTVSILSSVNRVIITAVSIAWIEAKPSMVNATGIAMSAGASFMMAYSKWTAKAPETN